MPAVPDWSSPIQFDLTNPYNTAKGNGPLLFNVQTASGLYLLDGTGCSFEIETRVTKTNVPQSDGSILHRRFLTGAEMALSIQLWESPDVIACGAVLATMLDDLSGALRSLLNAGDNEGRLSWEVSGKGDRMLDDIRLLVYPSFSAGVALPVVTVRIDSKYPYAEDLTQTRTTITDGNTATLTNDGTAALFPVYQVYLSGGTTSFSLTNTTNSQSMTWSGTLGSGGPAGSGTTPPGEDYIEIDTFNNTMFLNGISTDELPGLFLPNSLFPQLEVGGNDITIVGADVDILWQNAWA